MFGIINMYLKLKRKSLFGQECGICKLEIESRILCNQLSTKSI